MGHLHEVAIFLAAAVVSVPLFKRLGLGSVLGYLAAGALIGPFALRLITDVDNILHFSELGVVMLLFLIGLELEPKRLWTLRRSVFGLGAMQMLVTGGALTAAAWLLGLGGAAALVAGAGLALSSTAIGLQLLAERNEMAMGQGRLSFSILLFQDLAVIPLLAIVPLLAEGGGASDESTLVSVAKAMGVLVGVIVAGRVVIRPLFRVVAATRVREVFTAAALLVVLGTAILVSLVGMSMALGAFLAGVLLADSEYRHELEADIEPFKGLLLGLFFIAVGMSADLGYLATHPLTVLGLAAGLMVLKALVLLGVGRLGALLPGEMRVLALALCQGGEFAFVLFTLAVGAGVLEKGTADLLIVVVSVSMAATPLLLLGNDKVLERWLHKDEGRTFDDVEEANAVIIAGFGRYAQIVARVLQMAGIGFTALESSPEQVDFVKRFGNKAYFGDASRMDLLRAAKAEQAKVFVLAIDDEEQSVRAAETVSRNFPNLRIFARARDRRHAYRLMDVGVFVLNRDTFFSSLDMAKHVLAALGLEASRAERLVHRFRDYDEDMLRQQHAVWHDEAKLIEAAAQARQELQSLFAEDKKAWEDSPDEDLPVG